MSGIAAVLGLPPPDRRDPVLERMVGAMERRGADRTQVVAAGRGSLAVGRGAWQLAPPFAGPVLVLGEGNLVVAADASVYGGIELQRSLRAAGEPPRGDSPSHLILAARRAWGRSFAGRIEGDFAFVLWDRSGQRALLARGGDGSRPLCYAEAGEGLLAASTPGGLLAHPRCPGSLDLEGVAAIAAGLWCGADSTGYRAIKLLPPHHTLEWSPGKGARLLRHWLPPLGREPDRLSFDEAAEELRELLVDAAGRRLDPEGTTAVWMSGGVDSPAVFGAGQEWIRRRRARAGDGARDPAHPPPSLEPVSMSYPPGDPGREDERITAVARRWRTPVRWVSIRDIPLLPRDPGAWATARDDPFLHPFEGWNRALARTAREAGARAAFTGFGGDQLFHLSPVHLADLFREGRWGTLLREWRRAEVRGGSDFLRWAVLPGLPPWLAGALRRLGKGRLPGPYLEEAPPPWFRADFFRRHGLRERDRTWVEGRWSSRASGNELGFYLESPFFSRVLTTAAGLALEEGVELRSPLYDRRIIAFACRRPWGHLRRGGENKRILRAAMTGFLPLDLLLPRQGPAGVTGGYLQRELVRDGDAFVAPLLESPLLAELGIVDPSLLKAAWKRYREGGGGSAAIRLLLTFQAELWLRSRLEGAPAGGSGREARPGREAAGAGTRDAGTVRARMEG